MRTENITLPNGESKEIEIGFLSYRLRNQIMDNCTQTEVVDGKSKSNLNIFLLQNAVLEKTIKGCTIDDIDSETGDKLFSKYFGRAFGMGDSMGNSEPTSE